MKKERKGMKKEGKGAMMRSVEGGFVRENAAASKCGAAVSTSLSTDRARESQGRS